MKTNRAIIYTRVSTGRQAEEGTSLEVQEDACLRKAQSENAQIVDIISDEGVSGALYVSRPGIQKALRLIETGEANMLITMKLDRSGRNVDALRLIRNRVVEAGGKLIFADGLNFENNAIGNLMFTQIAGYAEYEKEIIRERTMSGRRRRAEEGQQPSRSMSPYGYHIVTKQDVISGAYAGNLLGTYQIVPGEAEIVRRIFADYTQGASLESICRDLQGQGISTPRDGSYWRRCTVQRILMNPVYQGTPVFGRFRAKTDEARAATGRKVSYITMADEENWVYLTAPALVEQAVFSHCQERLASGRKMRTGNPDRVHTLSGLIICPCCGKRLRGKWIKRTFKSKEPSFDHFYQCQDAFPSSNPGRRVCNGSNYRAADMESLTFKAIDALVHTPELVERALEVYARRNTADTTEAE